MDLKTHLSNIHADEREVLANRCGTTRGHLQNVAYGYRTCAPELCLALERETRGAVTRQELRPDDFWKIWPDLSHFAPKQVA